MSALSSDELMFIILCDAPDGELFGIDERLRAHGRDDLADDFLKLQQDVGLEMEAGRSDKIVIEPVGPAIENGITQELEAAYVAVTRERVLSVFSRIENFLNQLDIQTPEP